MKELPQTYIDTLEKLDWSVSSYTDDGRVEIEKYSPAGEDFGICVEVNDFPRSVREYADGFDVDEHVALWIDGRGKRGVPETARELVEDAEAIQHMLLDLADALEGKKPAIKDEEAIYREELFRLMQEYPELPVIPMVDSDIVADDYCSWWVGHWGYATITEYIIGDERIFFKDADEDEVLDGIEEYRSVWEDWPEEKITETFNNLPWIKCIAVYITT